MDDFVTSLAGTMFRVNALSQLCTGLVTLPAGHQGLLEPAPLHGIWASSANDPRAVGRDGAMPRFTPQR